MVTLEDIRCSISAPSLALLVFKRLFVEKEIKDQQPEQWKALQKDAYYGGMSVVYNHIVSEKSFVYDINSSYPASMS